MNIYDLKLHEKLEQDNLTILRVPDGWIYTLTFQITYKGMLGANSATQVAITSEFVKYSEEFKEEKNEEESVITEA